MTRILDKHRGVETISQLWRESQFVVFVGAGVSIESGLPSGPKLEKLVSRPLANNATTLLELRRIFLNECLEPNEIHRLLTLLLARYYVTTNWDRLLESSFAQLLGASCGKRFQAVVEAGDISKLHRRAHACIKLHGDLESPMPAVWSEHAYHDIIRHPNEVSHLVSVLLAMHPVLFVGYSLSDLDVVGVLIDQLQWNVGVPPERFAVFPKKEKRAVDRCRQLDIHPVCLDGTGKKFAGEVKDFLTRLWERIEGYQIYTRPLDDDPEDTVISRYERFWALYRAGQFAAAQQASKELLASGHDWRQDIPLFARFAYFTIKTHDKLEEWRRVESLDVDRFQPAFNQIQRVLPKDAFQVIKSQYEAGMAMPHLRSGQFEEALDHINSSLMAKPHPSSDPDLQCLYGDRLTIRAIIRLAKWTSLRRGKTPMGLLEEASRDLAAAEKIFKKYAAMGKKNEIHYVGRFYGARAFVSLAHHETGKPVQRRRVLSDAHKAHGKGHRVPYGKMAGMYCEAYCRYRFGVESSDSKRSQTDLTESLSILSRAASTLKNLQPMAQAKIYSLAEMAARALGEAGGQHEPWANYESMRDQAVNQLIKRGYRFVEEGRREKWLQTPLN